MRGAVLTIVTILLICTIFSILLFQDTKEFTFDPNADLNELIKNPQYTPVTFQYFFKVLEDNFTIEFDLTASNYEAVKRELEIIQREWELMFHDTSSYQPIDSLYDLGNNIFVFLEELLETIVCFFNVLFYSIYFLFQCLTFGLTFVIDILDMLGKVSTLAFKIIANPVL